MTLPIEHTETGHHGSFHIDRDGKPIAKMTYSRANASLINIDHTVVDASLGGQGVGKQLLAALVLWARDTKTKVTATCPFAKAQFDKDPTIRDVLA